MDFDVKQLKAKIGTILIKLFSAEFVTLKEEQVALKEKFEKETKVFRKLYEARLRHAEEEIADKERELSRIKGELARQTNKHISLVGGDTEPLQSALE